MSAYKQTDVHECLESMTSGVCMKRRISVVCTWAAVWEAPCVLNSRTNTCISVPFIALHHKELCCADLNRHIIHSSDLHALLEEMQLLTGSCHNYTKCAYFDLLLLESSVWPEYLGENDHNSPRRRWLSFRCSNLWCITQTLWSIISEFMLGSILTLVPLKLTCAQEVMREDVVLRRVNSIIWSSEFYQDFVSWKYDKFLVMLCDGNDSWKKW